MGHWDIIRRKARDYHVMACAVAKGKCTAEALLAAADELTRLKRVPVAANNPLLGGAEAVLDLEAKIIWYNQDVEPELALYYQAHEYAHNWQHGERCVCGAADIDSGASDGDLPLGIQWVEGYSPRERHEREANVFAREFLLPIDKLRQWFIGEGLNARTIAGRVGLPAELVFHQLTHALLTVTSDEDTSEEDVVELKLDLSQGKAAHVPHGPFLLEAGPGTGKTRTLIGRILFLLERRVLPDSILALTFSNRAAEEIRARVAQVAPEAAPHIWMGTFHAFGLELLHKFGSRLNLPPRLPVLDPVDAVFILERELPSLELQYYQNLYEPTTYLGHILSAISRAKDELVSPIEYTTLADRMLAEAVSKEEIEVAQKAQEVARVYVYYQQYLEQNQLLDFGDLIFHSVTLLRTHADIKEQVQQTYSHILVDEYQDVNRASGLFLREMAGDGKGLWVVGDVRQAIYRFRGAAPINMRLFPEDFPGAQAESLRRNYRSQPAILNLFAAFAPQMRVRQHSAFIPWEADRLDSGGIVLMEVAESREAEGSGIAGEIKRQQAAGVRYRDQAVLCRSHSQLGQIAISLEQAGIPLLSLGNLFERNEIRDLLSLLSLACEGDGLGLLRVAHFAEYQIPLTDALTLIRLAGEQNASFPDALELARDAATISSSGKQGLALLEQHLNGLSDSNAWSLLVRYLFERSSYLRILLNDASVLGQQKRLAIFQLLQLAYRQRDATEEKGQDPKSAFLHYVRRLQLHGVDKQLQQVPAGVDQIDAVRLLTVHAAKGLEFDIVYLPFLGRGYFPAKKQWQPCPPPLGMLKEEGDGHAEEEECLFFVALSRARDTLCLSRARNYGRTSHPSDLLTPIASQLPHPPDGEITWSQEKVNIPGKLEELPPISDTSEFEVEALHRYLDCPRRYFYEFVLGLSGNREDSAYVQFHRCVYKVLYWLEGELTKGHPVDEATAQARLATIWQEQGPLDHPYEVVYRYQAEEMITRAIDHFTLHQGQLLQPKWQIRLKPGLVQFQPDRVELSSESSPPILLVQRFRTGRPSESELEKDIYALYQKAAEQAYPDAERQIQVLYLSTNEIQDVSLSSRTITTRLGHYETAITGILCCDFPARPDDRQCPRCPYYFICPMAEDA